MQQPLGNEDMWSSRHGNRLAIILNIPNSLTILRILLIPVIVGCVVYGLYDSALIAFLVAALTDSLDGTIARMTKQHTQFGAYLDPLADKMLLMATFLTLALCNLVPIWSVIIVVSRDVMLLMGFLVARLSDVRIVASPTILGKMTTLSQVVCCLFVLVSASRARSLDSLHVLFYVMSIFTIVSGIHYIFRGISQIHDCQEVL